MSKTKQIQEITWNDWLNYIHWGVGEGKSLYFTLISFCFTLAQGWRVGHKFLGALGLCKHIKASSSNLKACSQGDTHRDSPWGGHPNQCAQKHERGMRACDCSTDKSTGSLGISIKSLQFLNKNLYMHIMHEHEKNTEESSGVGRWWKWMGGGRQRSLLIFLYTFLYYFH